MTTNTEDTINNLSKVTGHEDWTYENGRYTAVQIVSGVRSLSSGQVRRALTAVIKQGAIGDVDSIFRIPHKHPDENGVTYYDSVSFGEDSLDLKKLERAAAQATASTRLI